MRISNFIWFFKRGYSRHLIPILKSKIAYKKEKTSKEAEVWSKKLSMDDQEVFQNLFPNIKYDKLSLKYPKELEFANNAVKECPVKLGGGGAIDLLYNLTEVLKVERAIETGVAYGWSSLSILLSLSRRKGKLISTDMPYVKIDNDKYVGCAIPEYYKRFWEIIRKPDIYALPEALNSFDKIELCHYDSDKSYAGRIWAYKKIWKKLTPNGLLVSDDIQDNLAFKDFSDNIKSTPYVVEYKNKFIGILKKQ